MVNVDSRILCLATLLVSQYAMPQNSPSKTKSLPDIVDSVKTSIVRLEIPFTYQVQAAPDNAGTIPPIAAMSGKSFGTGFMIDETGRIATAMHVVDAATIEAINAGSLTPKGMTFVRGSLKVTKIDVLVHAENVTGDHGTIYNVREAHHAFLFRQDANWDVAIVFCSENLLVVRSGTIIGNGLGPQKRTLPEFQIKSPRLGDEVSVLGFPSVLNFEQGIPGITMNSGKIANTLFKDEQGRFEYLTDMHINHGDSGGPVFENETGKIIGFLDAYRPAVNGENSGLSVIIPIQHVLELLPSP